MIITKEVPVEPIERFVPLVSQPEPVKIIRFVKEPELKKIDFCLFDNPDPLSHITDHERIRVEKSKQEYTLNRDQIKACDRYREALDELWLSTCGGHDQNATQHQRQRLFDESTRLVKFINANYKVA